MIAFPCPQCGASLRVKKRKAGKLGRCPTCKQSVRAPLAELPPQVAGTVPRQTPLPFEPPSELPGPEVTETEVPADVHETDEPPVVVVSAVKKPRKEDYSYLAPPQAPCEIGRLGRYRILKVLGSGGMGTVFEAEDPYLRRRVAIKAMKPSTAAKEAHRQRFVREAQAVASIVHDHIVTVYQVDEDNGIPYMAMQLLQGETLDDRLRREGGWLPLREVLRIGRELAEGLDAAHARGLVHRDIKPGNILLEKPRDRVKIVDFGLARAADGEDARLTLTGVVMGTPAYMAPEQANGQAVDHRGDLFSLGSVLYQLCTGQLAFRGTDTMSVLMALATQDPEPPRRVDPTIPPAFSDLIVQLLSKDPDLRPKSARAVVEAIEAIERVLEQWQSVAVPKPPSQPVLTAVTADAPAAPPPAQEEDVVVAEAPRPRRKESGAVRRVRRPAQRRRQWDQTQLVVVGVATLLGLVIMLCTTVVLLRVLQ